MKYYDVTWHHVSKDEPYRLVSEIGADNFEKRKLEFFHDGRVGYASELMTSDTTMLGIHKVLALEEIISQPDFSGETINQQQFEALWQQHVAYS